MNNAGVSEAVSNLKNGLGRISPETHPTAVLHEIDVTIWRAFVSIYLEVYPSAERRSHDAELCMNEVTWDKTRTKYIKDANDAVRELETTGIKEKAVQRLKEALLALRKDAAGRIHNEKYTNYNVAPLAVCPDEES